MASALLRRYSIANPPNQVKNAIKQFLTVSGVPATDTADIPIGGPRETPCYLIRMLTMRFRLEPGLSEEGYVDMRRL